ncbi:MAG: UDP-N-acetylglucosamine 2-epimerase (hydrolyzing) [Parcubacteria group bacterium CG10_big_fil_rev_8_21_14_0_10_36_14]|nr:MAG: UDP-N-acetylglucosamine 2-epimerase (hydrolyzing) [Parcubacteria group bacterium CG10_big_fil_rev_8_21_14_0_10_36_14]
MQNKRKIAVLIINRANYGRLKPVLRAIQEHPDLELQLIVGSSMLLYRFGNDIDYIERDGFKISAKFNMIIEGGTPTTMAQSAGLGLMNLPTILEQLNPDIFLVNADRFEILPAAIAAAYMNITLAHTLGGEITGTIDESVRHAVTKLAHIHFAAHKPAAERIASMGEDPNNIFIVGNPSLDIAKTISEKINIEKFIDISRGTGSPIDFSKPYILCYQHPVTTEYQDAYKQIITTLEALRNINIQTIMLWPNPDAGTDMLSKGIRVFREKNPESLIHFYRSFANEDYLSLIKNASCIVGNSSSAIMEGGFFGTPAVNIGTRQQGREKCINVVNTGYSREEIENAIKGQLAYGKYNPDYFFGDGQSAKRIAEILANHNVQIQKQFNKEKGFHLIKNYIN